MVLKYRSDSSFYKDILSTGSGIPDAVGSWKKYYLKGSGREFYTLIMGLGKNYPIKYFSLFFVFFIQQILTEHLFCH